ncbi:MAG: methyltransferase domain-containing protein [Streptosporangiales bacterium]|nr:methyltransferase domain-containing protein [Streptosporangiales bacterium]
MDGHGAAQGAAGTQEPGIVLTRVRRYNLLVAVMFGGRRRALNTALASASGAGPGDLVLDIGCGPGHFAGLLAQTVGPHGQVVGVDPSAPMIVYANRHAGRRANCRFELAPAQSLDLPDAAFDVVTSTFAMHHIPSEARTAALAQMYRVLRPGGRLLIADAYPSGSVAPRVAHALTWLSRLVRRRSSEDDSQHAADPFADVDVRHHAGALREIGFTEPRFTDVKPWTRYLVTTKPA